MSRESIESFLDLLKESPAGAVFNPWWQVDKENDIGPRAPRSCAPILSLVEKIAGGDCRRSAWLPRWAFYWHVALGRIAARQLETAGIEARCVAILPLAAPNYFGGRSRRSWLIDFDAISPARLLASGRRSVSVV